MLPNRPPTTTESREMITMAEEELSRLQRQLRIMEEDRTAFSEETGTKLRKQRKIIGILREEQTKLLEDINLATCSKQKRQDKRYRRVVYKLLEDYERYCVEVREESGRVQEVDVQIRKLENDIRSNRPNSVVTDTHYQQCVTTGQKTIQVLQNRLDNIAKKFCMILTENNELRHKIDHLLKERCHYNAIWDKLLKDLNTGKKFMVDLVEQAILAFDQREEWCSKLEALKKRAKNDDVLHTEEMRQIQRNLDHHHILREFLSVKGQKRILKDLEEKEQKKRELHAETLDNQLKMFQDTLEQVKGYCDCVEDDDPQKISAWYLKQEEENFALFNYVNELNHEIEQLEASTEELKEKIENQVEISKKKSNERQATLSTLKSDLAKSNELVKQEQDSLQKVIGDLQKILEGIEVIFDLLMCDRGPILELLGENTSISLFNVKIYLGSIEKKLSDMITEIYFAEKAMSQQSKKITRE